MPEIQTQFFTHRFDGGWAPDYGSLVSGLPTQTSQIPIPYVLDAKNVFWRLDGGVRKVGGTAQLGSQLGSGAVIYGVYDYWRMGTAGTPAQRKICHVGTTIQQDQGTNTWTSLFAGLESGKHPNYSTFNDLLIIASDSNTDVPKSWDQTTAQSLAGSPPNFAFSVFHKNRQWASGDVSAPSRVYYSADGNPEDWTGYGSGQLDISPGDGDQVTGLAGEYKGELLIFKGPNRGSIHRITGSVPADFARVPFIQGLPCVGHSTIARFRDDLLFMTPSGSIRSLKATAAYGDYNDTAITFPINQWLLENLNISILKRAWMVNDSTTSHLYVAVPTGSSTTNDYVLCYDYQFGYLQKPDRWSYITAWPTHCLATYIASGLPRVMGGGDDGYVRNCNVDARNIDTDGIIRANLETPHLNYGRSSQMKTLTQVGLTLSPLGNDTIDFGWTWDTQWAQTETISQGDVGAELLDDTAPDPDAFLLSDDTVTGDTGSLLGGVNFNEVYADLVEGGEGRWVQYAFSQEVLDEDLFMHAFSVGMQFDATSLE